MTWTQNSCLDPKNCLILKYSITLLQNIIKMRLLKMQKGLDYFKDKPRPNLKKTESINLGTSKETKER